MSKITAEGARMLALLLITVLLLGASAWLASTGQLTVEAIQGIVQSGGMWSPVVYLALATVLPVAFVPRWLLTAAAAALFGLVPGACLGLVGGLGGALSGYVLGWKLGNPYLEAKAGRRLRRLMEFISRHGFAAIALGRINPAMSCEVVSLASGIAAIRMRTYIAASVVGMLPGSALYAYLGAGAVTPDRAKTTAWYAVFFVTMSIATGVWFWWVWKRDMAMLQAVPVPSSTATPPSR